VEAVCVAVSTESLGTQHLPSGHFDAAVVAFSAIQPRSWTQVNESIDACLPLPRLSIAVCALHVPLLASPAVHLAHQKADTPVITSAAVRRFVQAKSASLERAGLGRSLQAFALSQIPTITLDGTATSAEIQRLDATTLDDLSAWIDTVVEKRADVRGGSSQFEMTWSQQIALGQSHFEDRAQLVEWFTVEHDEHPDDQLGFCTASTLCQPPHWRDAMDDARLLGAQRTATERRQHVSHRVRGDGGDGAEVSPS
jgi:hypothetical protein